MSARRRARSALAVGVATAAAIAAVLTASRSASSDAASPVEALAAPARPAFVIPEPQGLSSGRLRARWAPVVSATQLRARPTVRARAITSVETRTPEGTTNVVDVTGAVRDTGGELWVQVRVPGLPTNLSGWVPRETLGGYTFVHTRLVVDLERRSAELFRDGRSVFRASVGIGEPISPTPTGEYYVRSRIWSLRSSFYGPLAFGTSARSRRLTDWPGGGFIGIHGTNQPWLIPGRVSHGCIRMRNADILELGRLMPVGTPVTIR